jgi:DNA-binding transcriptional LysR family regulator
MADRRLQVFHAVTKQLSFTKAAEVLFMTQGAVAFQIKQLEEHFNTRLFDRGHQRIALTRAGELALEYTERILGLSAEMNGRLGEMTGEIRGPLLVGASTSIAEFMLPGILCEFKSRHPSVKPCLVVANSETIETRVTEHKLDIGLIGSPSHQPTLQNDALCGDELQVICSPKFPLAKFKELTAQQLLGYPYISHESGSGTHEYTLAYLRQHGGTLDPNDQVMELGSPEAINGVVEMGLGFAIASRAALVRAQRSGDLVGIPLKPRLMRTLSMVYPKKTVRSRLANTFIDFASTRLKQVSAMPSVASACPQSAFATPTAREAAGECSKKLRPTTSVELSY